MRRRRRRNSFGARQQQRPYVFIGLAVLVTVGLLFFFIRQADELAPEPRETVIELPNAFQE